MNTHSETNTQATTNATTVAQISPAELATIISTQSDTNDMILVDVRKQEEFELSHHNKAVSLSFPQILWRRLIRSKGTSGILDSFLTRDTQILKRRHEGTLLVLYDENTTDFSLAPASSHLKALCEIFSAEGTKFVVVTGGFQAIKLVMADAITTTLFASSYVPCLAGSQNTTTPIEENFNTLPLNFFLNGFMAVGSEENAHDIGLIEQHKITHVLNITQTECIDSVKSACITMQIPILDSATQDILEYLGTAIEFIHTARAIPNAKLLIHCHAGISRSTSFAIAYVMWAEHMSMNEAYALVRTHRIVASPNINFIGQLITFGKFLPQDVSEIIPPAVAATRATEYLCTL